MPLRLKYPELYDIPQIHTFTDKELTHVERLLEDSTLVKYIEHILGHSMIDAVQAPVGASKGPEVYMYNLTRKAVISALIPQLYFELTQGIKQS